MIGKHNHISNDQEHPYSLVSSLCAINVQIYSEKGTGLGSLTSGGSAWTPAGQRLI